MNLGRIILNYIDDEDYRRHSLAPTIYHGHRGEMYEKYREGQEDQLNALGLATNAIVLWNTVYMQSRIRLFTVPR